jgi:hypothetical protein
MISVAAARWYASRLFCRYSATPFMFLERNKRIDSAFIKLATSFSAVAQAGWANHRNFNRAHGAVGYFVRVRRNRAAGQ